MTYEIFTYGGGEIIIDVLNAIVRIMGSGTFTSTLRISLLFAVFMTLSDLVFNGDFTKSIKWYISFLLVYNIAFLAKVDVKVTDRVNPNMMMGSTVDNVPFALGLMASVITTIGDSITRLFDMNFALPNDLQYSKHGMLFGSGIMTNINSSRIQNPRISVNLNEFYKQCVIKGVMLGRYSMEEISKSTELLKYLKQKNTGIITYIHTEEDNNKISINCSDTTRIQKDMQGETANSLKRITNFFSKSNSSSTLPTTAIIGDVYSYVLGISQNASQIIEQNLMMSALIDATESYSASTGADASATSFAVIKDDLQKKMTSSINGKQANKWLPLFKIVSEAFAFGIFPIIILMAILPNGYKVLLSYFGFLIYLQLWSPLFAILHRIMMGELAHKGANLILATTEATTNAGINLSNFIALQNLNDNIATQAGIIAWSIPAIAAVIMKGGLLSATGLISGSIAGAQYTSNQMASEVSSGNVNYGNASMNNASYNNTNANKHNTDFVASGGKSTISDGNGYSETTFQDGKNAVNTKAMESSLLVDASLMKNESNSISRDLQEVSSQRKQAGEDLSTSQSYTNSVEKGLGGTHSIRVNDMEQLREEDRELLNIGTTAGVNGGLGVNIGIAKLGSSLDASERNERVQELAKSGVLSIEDSKGVDITDKYTHSLSQQENLNNTISELTSQEKSLMERQSYVSNTSLETRENLNYELNEYANSKYTGEEKREIFSNKDLTAKEFSKMIEEKGNYDIYDRNRNNKDYGVDTSSLDNPAIGNSRYNDNRVLQDSFEYQVRDLNTEFINKRKEAVDNADLRDEQEEGFKDANTPKDLREEIKKLYNGE